MQILWKKSWSNVIQPWSVSIPAQEAGIAALSEDTYVHNTRWLIREETSIPGKGTASLEMETFDSQANYLFFKGPEDLEEQCQKRGLLIRDCSNYRGLSKGYFRIAVRTREENDQLIKIFQDIIRRNKKKVGRYTDGESNHGARSCQMQELLAAGLCRIFAQDGYKVAPFKSQNMALNSFITEEGLEMGRAQVMQAEAAGIKPSVYMNPILLKPTNDVGSQVIVNGEVLGTMSARDYFRYKKKLVPDILKAFHKLSEEYDIIVIEGAGSPAEINLKSEDIENMGMAKMAHAPVLLVGDIDRGGVFAQLVGTVELLEKEERARIKGLIINKFRGDKSILDPGIEMLEERVGIPVVGVTPYLHIEVEDEDSLTERFCGNQEVAAIDLAVIRLPRISNFTDFNPFESMEGVALRYVTSVSELKNPDMIRFREQKIPWKI